MPGQSIQIEQVPIDCLKPDASNPRRISKTALANLTRSIKEFGFIDPVIARREDRVVVGGHQRLLAARKAGMKTVPVVYLTGLSEERSKLIGLALNKVGGYFDDDLLGLLFKDLSRICGLDLSLSGFEDDELTKLIKKLNSRERRTRLETFNFLNEGQPAQTSTKILPGDVYFLCDHRLMCGNAVSSKDCERLLMGQQAAMAFLAPHNCAYDGAVPGQRRRRRPISNDDLSPTEWRASVTLWAGNLLSAVDGALYICIPGKEWPVTGAVLQECGAHWADTLIWAKDRFDHGRSDYQRQYQAIWYGWREGTARHWSGGRDQGDVLRIESPTHSKLDPSTLPLALVERAIENSSRPGDRVLDLFLGSGSTLIAAERTNRVCYGLELDPSSCSLAIARWESFTGLHAEKVKL